MTSSRSGATLAGPLYRTLPQASGGAGPEAVELAASAGLVLDPWQVDVVHAALAERPDGRWAAREVGLIVPRQNGKGSILEAVELAGLYLLDEGLILHSAHEFKTATEAFRRIWQLIESTPDLDKKVMRKLQNNNDMSIELKNRCRLRFVARTGGSGRGFSGDRVILDEAFNLPDKAISALMPTMAARPNPQIWYTSSAPLEDDNSAVLRRLCKRGREGSPALAYFEWCCPDGADPADADAWALANPGYPLRIDSETIALERASMLAEDFARERLGIWIDPLDGAQSPIPPESWAACQDASSGIEGPLSFALEVAEDRSWAAFASAGKSTLGDFVHGEVVDYREGTAWVVQRAVELKAKWGGKLAIAKGSPAASLIEDLKRAGFIDDDLVELSTEDHAKACGQLYDAVVNGEFRHLGQQPLDISVRGAVRRDVGDAWVWSRRKSTTDISPLVAVTLAAYSHRVVKTEMALPEVFTL